MVPPLHVLDNYKERGLLVRPVPVSAVTGGAWGSRVKCNAETRTYQSKCTSEPLLPALCRGFNSTTAAENPELISRLERAKEKERRERVRQEKLDEQSQKNDERLQVEAAPGRETLVSDWGLRRCGSPSPGVRGHGLSGRVSAYSASSPETRGTVE